jgi:hypothetical protein
MVVKSGETVVHEGRTGSSFFIVEQGELVGRKSNDPGSSKYSDFATFGDFALLHDCPYEQVNTRCTILSCRKTHTHTSYTPAVRHSGTHALMNSCTHALMNAIHA